MLFPQSRLFYILLHDIRRIFVNTIGRLIIFIFACAIWQAWVFLFAYPIPLCCFIIFLSFKILIKCCLLSFKIVFNSLLKFFKISCNEDAFALTSRLRLNNKHYRGICIASFLSYESSSNFFVSFLIFAVIIFLNFMKVRRVQPCVWEKTILSLKFFSKPP